MSRENTRASRYGENPKVAMRKENAAKRAERLDKDCGPDRDSRESVSAYQAQLAEESAPQKRRGKKDDE